jgi:parallel beta-helix repeat protein
LPTVANKMRKPCALLLILLTITALSTAAIQIVDGNGGRIVVPDNYPTIQDAVDHANEGGTVFVRKGTYEESVTINKSLSLIGEDKTQTTILGGWQLGGTVVLVTHDNVTISGFTIQSNANNTHGGSIRGVHLLHVQGCKVSDCTLSWVGIGVWLYESQNNLVEDCYCDGLSYFTRSGVTLERSSKNRICNNTLFGSEQAGIEVFSSDGNTITDNILQSKWAGINSEYSNNNTIADNSITAVRWGVWLRAASSHNEVEKNSVTGSLTGIQVNYGSSYNTVEENTITGGKYCGIEVHDDSNNNRVTANNISGNTYGVEVKSAINNTIQYNNITGCSKIGALFTNASGNLIQRNNFLQNAQQAYSSGSSNTWDADCNGNFWDTYNATDNDGNGVGDASYVIDESNIDHYPLTQITNNILPIEAEPVSPTPQPQDYSLVVIPMVVVILLVALAGIVVVLSFRKQKASA